MDKNLKTQDYVAQMYLWEIKKGRGNENLKRFLIGYISRKLDAKDERENNEQASDILTHLSTYWRTPHSALSFPRYISLLARGWKKARENERRDKSFQEHAYELERGMTRKRKGEGFNYLGTKDLDFPMSLYRAADILSTQLEDSPGAIYYFLRRQMNQGKFPNAGRSLSWVTKDGAVVERNEYLLDEDGFQQAKTFLERRSDEKADITEKRNPAIGLLMKKRKVGKRAAQRWLKRRLDRGQSWEEIGKEVEILRREEDETPGKS